STDLRSSPRAGFRQPCGDVMIYGKVNKFKYLEDIVVDLLKSKGCEAGVIEHSVNVHTGKELITLQLRYWRAIHSSLMSHRIFSLNVSSSRGYTCVQGYRADTEQPGGPYSLGIK
ncbi:hypothetical protein, partial [Paraburkholderia humisilvae]